MTQDLGEGLEGRGAVRAEKGPVHPVDDTRLQAAEGAADPERQVALVRVLQEQVEERVRGLEAAGRDPREQSLLLDRGGPGEAGHVLDQPPERRGARLREPTLQRGRAAGDGGAAAAAEPLQEPLQLLPVQGGDGLEGEEPLDLAPAMVRSAWMPRPVLYALAATLLASGAAGGSRPAVIPLTLPSGRVLQVEVMVNDEDRAMGLMFRPSLPQDRGMLFVFDEPGFHGIWMKNCRFPIDILWLDEERKVVHVAEAVPPCRKEPCPTYRPLRKAAYVVELNAGQARREEATLGAAVEFTLPR